MKGLFIPNKVVDPCGQFVIAEYSQQSENILHPKTIFNSYNTSLLNGCFHATAITIG